MLDKIANLRAHGIGPASEPKMGPTSWRRPTEYSLAGVLSAEHFVHARRSGMERYYATADVYDAIRYVREAYAAGWRVPCLSKHRRNLDGTVRKGFVDCVPERI